MGQVPAACTRHTDEQYDAPIIAGDCNVTVNKLADYLKEVGY